MNLGRFVLFCACLMASCKSHPRSSTSLSVRTTAYTSSEADHIKYGNLNAVSTTLRSGAINSAASDWSFLPLGTKFRIVGIPDKVYIIDDYGSALVGTQTIDIYCPTRQEMNEWGVKNVDIEIIQFGSYSSSLRVLHPRRKHGHVESMASAIREAIQNETL